MGESIKSEIIKTIEANMIERYSRKEMSTIWTLENRFQKMLKVEKTVAFVQGELGLIPKESAHAINTQADFRIQDIQATEEITRHDVTAFIQVARQRVEKPHGSYLHYGLTSSDVLDTALALQIKDSAFVLEQSFNQLHKALWEKANQFSGTLCLGRTHGMWAEPVTFGWKLVGFLKELIRNKKRTQRAIQQAQVGKMSGAVGAYHVLPKEVEQKVCEKLNISAETLATQVVPRDRYAEMIGALAITASGLERLSVEIRHLQKSDTGEVSEGFKPGQTGSSAMPHKKNPIYSENITGLSRILRSYVGPALENIVLWHERDISHSSVERMIFPSAFTLCDFALVRLAEVIANLQVNEQQMKHNLQRAGGVVFSSVLLAILVQKGFEQSSAYQLIQSLSMNGKDFQTQILNHPDILKRISKKELTNLFSLSQHSQNLQSRVQLILKTLRLKS